MSDEDHVHNVELMKLDEAVKRLRNTAASYDWDCKALLEVLDKIPPDGLCDVLTAGLGDLHVIVYTMNEAMAIMGNQMMGQLNSIAAHITLAHVQRMQEVAAAANPPPPPDGEPEGEPGSEPNSTGDLH